jgi:hypothetical protein
MGLRIETGTFEPGEGSLTKTRLMLEDPGYDITAVEVHPIKHLPGKGPDEPERRYLMVTVIGATKGHIVQLISSGRCNVRECMVVRTRLTRERVEVEEELGALEVAIPLGPEEQEGQYHVVSSEPQAHIEYLVWRKLVDVFNEEAPPKPSEA